HDCGRLFVPEPSFKCSRYAVSAKCLDLPLKHHPTGSESLPDGDPRHHIPVHLRKLSHSGLLKPDQRQLKHLSSSDHARADDAHVSVLAQNLNLRRTKLQLQYFTRERVLGVAGIHLQRITQDCCFQITLMP